MRPAHEVTSGARHTEVNPRNTLVNARATTVELGSSCLRECRVRSEEWSAVVREVYLGNKESNGRGVEWSGVRGGPPCVGSGYRVSLERDEGNRHRLL